MAKDEAGSRTIRRVGTVIYLKPEKIDEYKACHAAVWPEVLKQIEDCSIRDCEYLPPSH
jgi:L-rhamnose mutarotase